MYNIQFPSSIAHSVMSGKGTQCEYIRMSSGKLVPDEIIIGLILARVKEADCVESGWLLDGFPRTHAQALALADAGILPHMFLYLDVPDSCLVERVVGRRSDPVTGRIYHMAYSPPDSEEVRARLVHRADDTVECVQPRLEAFHANMSSIVDHYKDHLVKIDGNRQPLQIWNKISDYISSFILYKVVYWFLFLFIYLFFKYFVSFFR